MSYFFHEDELSEFLSTAAPNGSLKLLHPVVPWVNS